MQTKKDDSAFPIFGDDGDVNEYGLSKREYFAAIAMQGILAKGDISIAEYVAQYAIQQADELITALNRSDSNAI